MNDVGTVPRKASSRPAASALNADQPVRLDRQFLLFSLLAALLLSWPLLAFGRPAYIQDSAAYYKGGRAAVSFALAKIDQPEQIATGAQPAGTPHTDAARQASGVRSITYSVAAYLLSAPGATMMLLAIAQALAAGAIMVAALGAFGRLSARRTAATSILLAGGSTLAVTSFLVVPDIFAGLLIASMILLTATLPRLSTGVRLLCAAIAAFAMTAHPSHIPLAGGMTMLGLGWVAIGRRFNSPPPRWTWAWVIAPLLVGGLTILSLNRVAFGETSLTSKQYPFLLARSINDGPGRWYLEKNCPELRYTICTLYPHGLPKGGALEFLWGKDGIAERATPAQMDRVRAEEREIVLAAAREYAGYEVRKLSFNIARQLVTFRPYPFEHRLVLDETGTPHLAPAPRADHSILRIIGLLTAITAALGTAWLGGTFVRERGLRPVIALVFLGILGNAATCAILSAVSHRYQARVVWLIPLFALALYGSLAARKPDRAGD
jgi:hypothetical protein